MVQNEYNYVVTAHKSTAVTHATVGSFTGSSAVNLIVAKCSRLEIHSLTQEGLQGVIDVPIYGRIAVLQLFRPQSFQKDLLFILTERYQFCVLEYTSEGKLHTRANGDVSDQVGRPSEAGQMSLIDPTNSMIGLHLYDGYLKLIPIDTDGSLSQPFNVRMKELKVIALAFLHDREVPTFAVLYEDTKEQRHVKTYLIPGNKDKALTPGPWQESNLDPGSSAIIPIPDCDGCVILGERKVHFISSTNSISTSISPILVKMHGSLGGDGRRHLLGDAAGGLHLLVVESNGDDVTLQVEKLGETSQASSLCYLDSGFCFVGSTLGDSQLVKLHAQKIAETNSYLEIVDSMPNLGPILDFNVLTSDRQGQGQIVACSGGGKSGSLRIIRNGIGFNEQASVELGGVKGLWSLKNSLLDQSDPYLVISFANETRLLGMNIQDELDEVDLDGFDTSSNSVYCANSPSGYIQVTEKEVRIISEVNPSVVASWEVPASKTIIAASSHGNLITIASNAREIVSLQLSGQQLTVVAEIAAKSEVSCIDCLNDMIVAGFWDMTVSIYTSGGHQLQSISVGNDIMTRSILIAELEKELYLLCGLGDGSLLSYKVSRDGSVSEKKKIVIGTKPINLRCFQYRGKSHVFAASDRPTIIHSSSGKLVFSNLNESEVYHISSFNASEFPDSLALIKANTLEIGTMDTIQRLHVRTVPLHEHPRRIAHTESTKSFLVSTSRSFLGLAGKESDRLRLIDDQTFETLDSFKVDLDEVICSVSSVALRGEPRELFAVGTAVTVPGELESVKGYIRLFCVQDESLRLVSQVETKGAVYNIKVLDGNLVVAINSRVQVYRWEPQESDLIPVCGHSGHTVALYLDVRGNEVLVGDLMKSVMVLVFDSEEQKLTLRARDYNPAWMCGVMIMDESVYMGAENNYNLFVVKKNPDSAPDEERLQMNRIGQYHLGDFVNCFRKGSLVMKLPDSPISNICTVLYGTINGSIGIVASLTEEQFSILKELQDALESFIQGVGGFDHMEWRSCYCPFTRRKSKQMAFIDGDLLEQVLELSDEELGAIKSRMGDNSRAAQAFSLVEDFSRLH